jgi:hypothetical protein
MNDVGHLKKELKDTTEHVNKILEELSPTSESLAVKKCITSLTAILDKCKMSLKRLERVQNR